MRIWHSKIIPHLCRQHLLAVWREGLGCMKIITENKKGYRNHPATKEFLYAPSKLYQRLHLIRSEMLKRGYHPKELPNYAFITPRREHCHEWQSFEEQVQRLLEKGCQCNVKALVGQK